MVVIWRGYGLVVPAIVIGTFVSMQLCVDLVFGQGFYTATEWPKQAASVGAACLVGWAGIHLNHIKRAMLVDERTGVVVGKAPSHTLFLIPVEYWAPIVLVVLLWGLD